MTIPIDFRLALCIASAACALYVGWTSPWSRRGTIAWGAMVYLTGFIAGLALLP